MLIKIFKYDFLESGRKLLPGILAMLLLSLAQGIVLAYNLVKKNAVNGSLQIIFGILIVVVTAFIIGIIIAAMIIQITQYNSTIYGARGHLTNVLPVNTSSMLGGKLLSASLWVLISIMVSGIAIAIIFGCLFLNLGAHDQEGARQIFSQLLKQAREYGFFQLFAQAVLGTVIGIVELVITLYLCVSLGQLVSKMKVLVGIVAFFVISFIESKIDSLLQVQNSFDKYHGLVEKHQDVSVVINNGWSGIIVSLAFAVIFFFITRWLLSRTLNLE
ncbi:MAG: hypothetical protein KBA87_06900 [Lachnospiraceae bacterium]|jgi:hypothetical protein|nr:hypothetical protein [Lachnospiraceae bacterium]